MTDFMRRLAILLRQNLLTSICVVTVLVVGGMASAFVAVSQAKGQPLTPAEAAFAACETTDEENRLGLVSTTAYRLPDAGAPHGIIVVPRCSMNVDLSKDDPSYYSKDIDVYILMSEKQLTRLFDGAFDKSPRANYLYSVSDEALKGLITASSAPRSRRIQSMSA